MLSSRVTPNALGMTAHLRKVAPLVPLVLAVQDHLGTLATVSGRSMQPTFNKTANNDLLLLDKLSATNRWYKRGDVLVLASPHQPDEMITKRVIAFQGDLVHTRGGNVVHVPRGHIWIEGDNAHNSNDSNAFGPVAQGLVQACVRAKIWPLAEFGPVDSLPPSRDRVVPAISE